MASVRDIEATLHAWRENGADRLDPVRFRFLEALARRANGHGGEARRLLDDKLRKLVEAYRDALASTACKADDAGDAGLPHKPAAGPLADLVNAFGGQSKALEAVNATRPSLPRRFAHSEPELADYFRGTWNKVRGDRQLRQSLERPPGNAGPLNSDHLVHRALSLMQETSPEYLRQLLTYVDTLSWLERMQAGETGPGKDAPRTSTASPRKKTRARSR